MADCPTFWVCKTGMIFNHWRITQTPKEGATILKSWCSEMLFLVSWENIFCLKYLLNRLPFLCLFLFARCQVQVSFLYIILRGFFFTFSGYQVQLRTLWTLGVCLRIHLKIPELMSKSGFFYPDGILVSLFKQNMENTNEIRMAGQSVFCWIVGQSHGLHHFV